MAHRLYAALGIMLPSCRRLSAQPALFAAALLVPLLPGVTRGAHAEPAAPEPKEPTSEDPAGLTLESTRWAPLGSAHVGLNPMGMTLGGSLGARRRLRPDPDPWAPLLGVVLHYNLQFIGTWRDGRPATSYEGGAGGTSHAVGLLARIEMGYWEEHGPGGSPIPYGSFYLTAGSVVQLAPWQTGPGPGVGYRVAAGVNWAASHLEIGFEDHHFERVRALGLMLEVGVGF